MENFEQADKTRIAIVVVGYNRLWAIKRLLFSLLKANYNVDNVPLVISIDCSGNLELYNYVDDFYWPFGKKIVNIQSERLGLKNHIIKCGNLTSHFKGVIILEDDIYVSEDFYNYTIKATDYYYNDDRIAGISLHRNEVLGKYYLPNIYMNDGSDSFLFQSVASWGECFTDKMWNGFISWYNKFDDNFVEIDMPSTIKKWTKAWSKYYIAYLVTNNRYFIFPSVSLTTCFCDVGEHSSHNSCVGQVNLLSGIKNYNFNKFEMLVKYDVYRTNTAIYEWIGLNKDDLCVNFWGSIDRIENTRYILSPFNYPFSVIKSYGMRLRPIELNIRDNILGNDIHLYDTSIPTKNVTKCNPPFSYTNYFLRSFNLRLLTRYVIKEQWNLSKHRFKKLIRIISLNTIDIND